MSHSVCKEIGKISFFVEMMMTFHNYDKDDDNDVDDSVQMDTRWCARKWVKRVLSRLNTLLMTPAKNEVDVEVMMTTMTSIKDSKEEVENVSVVTF